MKNTLAISSSSFVGFLIIVTIAHFYPQSPTTLVSPENNSSSLAPSTSFSIENAPLKSLKAQIIYMSGKISWKSRTATVAAPLKSPIKLQQGEEVSTDALSILKIEFPLHLTLNIFPKTVVELTQTLPQNIVLTQDSGQVEYLKTGSDPLSIRAKDILIKEDGSDLEITFSSQTDVVSVDSLKGNSQVAFNDINYNSQVYKLKQGDTLIFNGDTKTALIQ